MDNYEIYVYSADIEKKDRDYIIENCSTIAVDTETTGLDPLIDDLCTIQVTAGERSYLVKFDKTKQPHYLIEVLLSENVGKIFHHANFDLRFLMHNTGVDSIKNVICTKIAAKLLYGTKERNSLKELLYKKLGVTISKEQQLSDWSKTDLSSEQIMYAINDTRYLNELWLSLESELKDTGMLSVAEKCFEFLPIQAYLHNRGIENIFTY